jgi:hypothetical protein
VKIVANELLENEYFFGDDYEVFVKEGAQVKEKQLLAKSKKDKSKIVATAA